MSYCSADNKFVDDSSLVRFVCCVYRTPRAFSHALPWSLLPVSPRHSYATLSTGVAHGEVITSTFCGAMTLSSRHPAMAWDSARLVARGYLSGLFQPPECLLDDGRLDMKSRCGQCFGVQVLALPRRSNAEGRVCMPSFLDSMSHQERRLNAKRVLL